ncbi:hypothetical protein CHS0354_021865 [Potamilus streckersoni]|uniref:Uncharacterized protein n=1 Tax=Potamilus streckersoni TaxID=2493646 RepID=A0AAE0SFV2_9BIVA|nr:hypothetical protein CHS0354_021865 [Potamilus streckersoni]
MTALTMKSTYDSYHMGKTFHPAKYGGGGHPQWMRTLEEKYQKLHKKITENTSIVPLPHSNISWRTVYDVRLAGMVSKYREKTPFVNSNNRRPSTFHSASRKLSAAKDRNSGANMETNKNIESKANKNGDTEVIQKKNPDSKSEIVENTDDCNNVNTEIIENNDEIRKISNLNIAQDGDSCQEKVTENATHINDLKLRCSIERLKEEKENEDPVQEVRYIKTSTSRVSRKTAKSCPAEIQTTSVVPKRPLSRTKLRSKSAHKISNTLAENGGDVFTNMSKEAQFAVTETIQEMNLMRSKTMIFLPYHSGQDGDLQQLDILQFERHLPENITLNENIKVVSQNEADCDRLEDGDETSSSESFNGSRELPERFPSSGLNGHRKLPNIKTAETDQYENSVKHSGFTSQQYRIPGVGKYDVPIKRENLFEITPPGFDIRYRDAIPFEERESETPPLIIRERAIQKCNEWLTKYTPV